MARALRLQTVTDNTGAAPYSAMHSYVVRETISSH
jgi:hypothetical protein